MIMRLQNMSKHSKSQIIAIEERLRQAMLKSDVAELDALIASELLFTSYLGQLITKEQDLDMHRSGILNFRELIPSEQHIQLNEGFSVVSVKMHILGNYAATAIDQHYRFTRIWATSTDESLQIVAGHAGAVVT
jgi:Domain of unknown function (DUF4440)